MKFGFVFSLWVILCPLFSQNCEEIAIGPVHYFVGTGRDKVEIQDYIFPCSKTPALTFTVPSLTDVDFIDPKPATPEGIILVLMRMDPEQVLVSISEFDDLLYKDIHDQPLYYSNPEEAIQVADLLNIGNDFNQYVLMPVLVTNMSGNGPGNWFEDDCVRLYPKISLTLIENPVEGYEFPHFDEITFTHWPLEVPITDYIDITFTVRETDEEIPYRVTDNRSFRLELPMAEGGLNFKLDGKYQDCQMVGIGDEWSFPTVELVMDTVLGFRNIEKCVPVRVFNFESVSSFQFSLNWDEDLLDFTAIKSIHPALEPYLKFGDIITSGDQNKIIIELPSVSDPLTLPDSAVLFEWCGKPLGSPGQYVEMNFSTEGHDSAPEFAIHGLETTHSTSPGGIIVQEDRELIYDLIQLCNTRDGHHRIELDIINDEAYPYTYSFHSGSIPDSIVRAIPFVIPDVPPGQYEFTIRDSFGFEITETFIVSESVAPGFELTVDPAQVIDPTCLNPFGGQIGVRIDPADQVFQLNLVNDDAEFTDQNVSGLVAGTYIVEAEDESGCIDTIHFTLQNPKEINIIWEENLVLCPDDQAIKLLVKDQSPIADNSVEFQLDGGEIKKLGDSVILKDAGQFPVQFWNDDGCILDTTFVVKSGPKEIVIWDTSSLMIHLGDTLEFLGPDLKGQTVTEWDYSGLHLGDEVHVQFSPEQSGILYYNAAVYGRCQYSDSLLVQVILPDHGLLKFDFPNVFSPNGDGLNDHYVIPPNTEIQQVQRMEVFDRYGNYIFERDYSEDAVELPGWDGRHVGVEVPPGVYAVQVELLLYDGRKETVSFDVMLLR